MSRHLTKEGQDDKSRVDAVQAELGGNLRVAHAITKERMAQSRNEHVDRARASQQADRGRGDGR